MAIAPFRMPRLGGEARIVSVVIVCPGGTDPGAVEGALAREFPAGMGIGERRSVGAARAFAACARVPYALDLIAARDGLRAALPGAVVRTDVWYQGSWWRRNCGLVAMILLPGLVATLIRELVPGFSEGVRRLMGLSG